jgi:hypothetical protein
VYNSSNSANNLLVYQAEARMSNTRYTSIAGLLVAAALVSFSPASAQMSSGGITAPVPGQILTAKRMFISNAGSESYGSQTYFRRTKYDGGPDRFYNQFYSAMKTWGRYELTDSPADADVVSEVRFTSPIVDKQQPGELVYDPQLTVTILDPKTRVALWSLTEHIQPARTRDGDNRNFDQAVARLVEQAKLLASSSVSSSDDARPRTMEVYAPVGALQTARWQEHWQHTVAGLLIGSVAGALVGWRTVDTCSGGLNCATMESIAADRVALHKRFKIGVGGALTGGLIGWFWPTH